MGVDHISSPCIGWTLGEPFFALRTCSRPEASSTCDHCGSPTPTPARRGGNRSGSWLRPDGRSGSTSWRPPSSARSRPSSDTRGCKRTLRRGTTGTPALWRRAIARRERPPRVGIESRSCSEFRAEEVLLLILEPSAGTILPHGSNEQMFGPE